jgi:hypothetical protein
MDPKVCGRLLTLHRRSNGVDVEALRDRIPLRQIAGKGPKMGSGVSGTCGGWNCFSWMLLGFREYMRIYRPRKEVRGLPRGPQARGRAPTLGRDPVAYGLLGTLLSSSPSPTGVFWSKKNHHERFILFGLRLIFLLSVTQKQGKNRNWHLALD